MNTKASEKHSVALPILFLIEMWERFAYYLMIGILFLYIIDADKGGLGFNNANAADIVGTFIALVYLTPFIGGLLADRYLGYIRSVFIGGLLMAAGYFTLVVPGSNALYIGLGLIILGNGLFKPNISTVLGNIYSAEDKKRLKDDAFNIFYMGINVGGFVCNFVAAYLRNEYGWGYAFAAAGVGLLIGLVILALFYNKVKAGDVKKSMKKEDMPMKRIVQLIFLPACIAAFIGWTCPSFFLGHPLLRTRSNDAFIFACIPIVLFYTSLWVRAKDNMEKKSIGSLLFIFFLSIVFWTIYNQNATGLTLWANDYTDRSVPQYLQKPLHHLGLLESVSDTLIRVPKTNDHFVVLYNSKGVSDSTWGYNYYFNNLPKDKWPVPPSHTIQLLNTELFQSINPLFIIIFVLIFLPIFQFLRKRNKEPSTAMKFSFACFIAGLSTLLMVVAIHSVPSVYHFKTSMVWLWIVYIVFTLSETFLSPLGLSLVSKLAPPRLTSVMMGGWFLSTSLGGKAAGILTGYWDSFANKATFFWILTIAAFLSGLILLLYIKTLNAILKDK